MFLYLLPEILNKALSGYDDNKVTEIRLRVNCPVVINYGGRNCLLQTSDGENLYCCKDIIEYVVKKATENSLYAYNHQIKQGFITARGGIRIGIAGESVNSDNFLPKTIKDIYSINIRIPHEVVGCSNIAFKFIYTEDVIKNTLIVSPPGAGKTTYLRDIARKISEIKNRIYNVLIVDERFEIASCVDGCPVLDVGRYSDVVSGACKSFAFNNAVRSMRPDVIITDEIASDEDLDACICAMNSGVKVIASVHADNILQLKDKKLFNDSISARLFSRVVILSSKNGPGNCESIFDENLNCIYF